MVGTFIAIGILIFVGIFVFRLLHDYDKFEEEQDKLSELPSKKAEIKHGD